MNDVIRISVVLAAYNGRAYVAEQLQSLLAVLAPDDEVVVADDASTDDTVAVVGAIADPRVRLLRFSERVGYQRNFARAIAASRGRFIFFSDQDDRCLPERIALSLQALTDRACICGDATVVDAAMQPLAPSYFEMRGATSFSALGLLIRPAAIGATMACRRSFLEAALPFPKGVPHDHWLSVLAASRSQLGVIRQPVILYRRHASVASLTGLAGGRRSVLTIARERFRLLVALARRALAARAAREAESLSDRQRPSQPSAPTSTPRHDEKRASAATPGGAQTAAPGHHASGPHLSAAGECGLANSLTLSVVSHGHGVLLDRLLLDLDACVSLHGARVVVTLNLAGESFDPDRYRRLSIVVVRNRAPRGFGANHNAAFQHCDSRWFAVVNPDLRIPPGQNPFQDLVTQGARDPRIGLTAPLVVNSNGDIEDSVRSNLSPAAVFARRLRANKELPRESRFRWFAGMCMVFRASAFRTIGGFDERYFLYCEDYDVCARLHISGYKLEQVASSRVVHDAQRDSHRSSKHLRWHMRSLLRVWSSRAFWRITLDKWLPVPPTRPNEEH